MDGYNEPIFVAANIEDNSLVRENISAAKHFLHLGGVGPLRRLDNMDPSSKRWFGIMPSSVRPKSPQCAYRDDPHPPTVRLPFWKL
jgi:hypothetical protein